MKAIISGANARAVTIEGERIQSLDRGDPSGWIQRELWEIGYLLADFGDHRVVEDTDEDAVCRELELACDCDQALQLILIALDAKAERSTRANAARDLEKFLDDSRITVFVESVLFSERLPETAEFVTLLQFDSPSRRSVVGSMIDRLVRLQPHIEAVCQAWERVPTSLFGSKEERVYGRRQAVVDGLFRKKVLQLQHGGAIEDTDDQNILSSWNENIRELISQPDYGERDSTISINRTYSYGIPISKLLFTRNLRVAHKRISDGAASQERRRRLSGC